MQQQKAMGIKTRKIVAELLMITIGMIWSGRGGGDSWNSKRGCISCENKKKIYSFFYYFQENPANKLISYE